MLPTARRPVSRPRTALTAGLAVALTACGAPRVEERIAPPPVVRVTVEHWIGTPLSGPQTADADRAAAIAAFPAEAALRLECWLAWLPDDEDLPELVPIASRGRLVYRSRGGRPLRAAPGFAERAMFGIGERALLDAGLGDEDEPLEDGATRPTRPLELGYHDAALPPGVTTSLHFRTEQQVEDPVLGLIDRRIGLDLGRGLDDPPRRGPTLGISVDDVAIDRGHEIDEHPISGRSESRERSGEEQEGPAMAPAGVPQLLQRELIVVDDPLPTDGTPVVLLIESPFGRGTFVAVLRTRAVAAEEATGLAHELAVSRARGAIRRTSLRHAPRPAVDELREFAAVVDSTTTLPHRRRALLRLAHTVDARLTEDLALVAGDPTLSEFLDRLLDRSSDGGTQLRRAARRGAAALAPLLETAALHFVASELQANRLPRPLQSALVRRCGEVGRFGGLLQDLANSRVNSLAEIDQLLVEENLAFLADTRASARTRAFDWLVARGRAPAEYDPLAPRDRRRQALRAAEQARAEAAGSTGR